MTLSDSGNTMFSREVHSENAAVPIFSIPSGKRIVFNELQFPNALLPMLLTPDGITASVKAVSPSRAFSGIFFIPFSNVTLRILFPSMPVVPSKVLPSK